MHEQLMNYIYLNKKTGVDIINPVQFNNCAVCVLTTTRPRQLHWGDYYLMHKICRLTNVQTDKRAD